MELSQINPLINYLVSQAETLGLSLSSDDALLMVRHLRSIAIMHILQYNAFGYILKIV